MKILHEPIRITKSGIWEFLLSISLLLFAIVAVFE
jgi:hypothetical protein